MAQEGVFKSWVVSGCTVSTKNISVLFQMGLKWSNCSHSGVPKKAAEGVAGFEDQTMSSVILLGSKNGWNCSRSEINATLISSVMFYWSYQVLIQTRCVPRCKGPAGKWLALRSQRKDSPCRDKSNESFLVSPLLKYSDTHLRRRTRTRRGWGVPLWEAGSRLRCCPKRSTPQLVTAE